MNQYNTQLPNNYSFNTSPSSAVPNYNTMQPATNQPFTNTITNSIVWVETEEEAKTWMVGPNNRVFVFVGDNLSLYVKEKNSDGRPLKTEIYDLTKRQVIEEGESVDLSKYVKKEDVSKMIEEAVSSALEENRRKNYRNNQNRRNSYRNGGMNDE